MTHARLQLNRPTASPWNLSLLASRRDDEFQSKTQIDDPLPPIVAPEPPKVEPVCKVEHKKKVLTAMDVTIGGHYFNASQIFKLPDDAENTISIQKISGKEVL